MDAIKDFLLSEAIAKPSAVPDFAGAMARVFIVVVLRTAQK